MSINVFAGSIGDSFFSSFNSKAHPIKTVLQDEPQQQQQQHSVDNCFTSFMGNTSLPFDIQVCLSIDYDIQAGLVLCQGCIHEKCCAIWNEIAQIKPSSHLKWCTSGGVRGLTTSSCIVYDYTTSEHRPVECIFTTYTVYICFLTVYLFIPAAVKM